MVTKNMVTIAHPRVTQCGHRLDLGRQPRHRNCESCWFAWFNTNGKVSQQCDEMFQSDDGVLIEHLQGTKFLKRWLQFMATLAKWKKQAEEQGYTNKGIQE